MARNIKALSPEELLFIKEKYKFSLFGDWIAVKCVGYDRTVMHSVDKSFFINTPIRKVTISKEAIDMWIKYFMKYYSLIEVQNAISILIVTYQQVNLTTVKEQLERKDARINFN